MSSFGLSEQRPARTTAAPKAGPTPAPVQQPGKAVPRLSPSPVPPPAVASKPVPPKAPAAPDAQSLDAFDQAAMDAAVQALLEEANQANTPAPARARHLAPVVHEAIQKAVREAVTAAAARMGVSAEATPRAGVFPEELSRTLREGVQTALHDGMAELVRELRPAPPEEAPGRLSPEEVASAIGAGLKDTLAQTFNEVAERMAAAWTREKTLMDQAGEALARQAAEVIRASQAVTAAVETLQQSVAASPAGARTGAKVEPFPAAKARALRAIPAPRISKPELDALEALDGPGLRMRSDERVRAVLESERPLAGYAFEDFLVGPANAFTLTVAKAVVEHPGGDYSPLFVHGGVGLGKTHLVNAIGNALVNHDPDCRVAYVSASRFARRAAEAVRDLGVDAFREHYLQWDVLIVDDVQFLAGRADAQEEFMHVFDSLQHEARQLIIAGRTALDQRAGLEESLVSRFTGGIAANLEPPEWETRMAILRHLALKAQAQIPDEILAVIAGRIPDDTRKMAGSLRKVIAFARLVGHDISEELVAEILSHLGVSEAA